MLEITIKLTAPANVVGGEDTTTRTAERTLQLGRTVTNEEELERLVKSFAGAAERALEELLAEVYAEFRSKAAAPAPKPRKGQRQDGAPE